MTTIRSKIIVNVIIILVAVLAVVSINYVNLYKLKKLQDECTSNYQDAVLAENASNIGVRMSSIIGSAEINREMDQSAKEWATAKEKEGKLLDELGKKVKNQEKELFSASKKAYDTEIALYEGQMLPLLTSTSELTDDMRRLDGEMDKLNDVIRENLEKVSESMMKDAKKSDGVFVATISKAIIESIIIGLVAILLQAGLATWLMRTIMKPVDALRVMLMDMSQGEGDLTKRLDDTAKDEFADVSRYFNLFIDKLRNMIRQIANTSEQVSSAASQLNATAGQIATGSEEVAAQAGTVATAGEEMAATSGDIAQNCQMVAEGA